ncbi:Isochorismatase-like protein [Paraphoma chrysanthemicola]|uniref:Isochorismatase-like protein n=1 Tax=Paraphoma chrysanthemicola TaxID=798071 RepID=A0A8K0QYT1_9PLEO|nr:Isochorismatase-like protein [Paraphoma chrysanthemicola]
MSASKIIPSRTALFLLDYQVINAHGKSSCAAVMSHAASIIKTARSKGITIAHCRVAFTESEMNAIPETNPTFYKAKTNPEAAPHFLVNSPSSAFYPDVVPQEGDIVVRKNRVGPFLNAPQDVNEIFRSRGIDTLILGGVSTGGAVAATVVQASDLDYKLFVLEDACADADIETHEFLMKNFAKRGRVIRSEDLEGLVE